MRSREWSDQEIREYYDSHLMMTLDDLRKLTVKTISEFKEILMLG